MATLIATEKAFEETIETDLLAQGYRRGDAANWDKSLALDRSEVFAFIETTQPDEWAKLKSIHGEKRDLNFLARLTKELDNRGTLDVLRHGIVDYGVRFRLAYFRPATTLNPDALRLYRLNRLAVYRQIHFSTAKPHDSVDMVLGVNGLPVATLELKNHLTGQTARDARHQYQWERDRNELLFSFKKRALVHFAVDPDEVWMTTKLNGKETHFLPFNRGYKHGAGNPPNPAGHRTAYLWREILQRDSLMDLLGRFLHLQTDTHYYNGTAVKREALIFPRYHQIDAVRCLEQTVKQERTGQNYLIQHSAGSGKSNTIAWLAHGLSSLHDDTNEPVYDSVIVITDRKVLDKQLQDTIYQFDHKQGVVLRIEEDARQLAEAITSGVKIIITTLQKFPFVVGKIDTLPRRRYALIVDEAHSSQTGEASDKVKEVLTTEYRVGGDPDETEEDVIRHRMESHRSHHGNLSFFAFTATPKPKTLQSFGATGEDGKPRPFHLYSMRQAIEEGFILDVLKNYVTYKRFFALGKQIEEDPRIEKKQAARAIARFVNLHPHNIAQKVEIIVEHFRQSVMQKIGGRAKAMVVTESRLSAVKYKMEVDHYLKEKNYTNIKALVAFSGTVKDEYDLERTEADMNGFGERELPEKFLGDDYRLLLVAEKYQTGFDQPLLHTMYVDKRLAGVRAVQTLSRLNRIYAGKDDTFVLDFVNDPEEIQAAFQPYYESTTIDQATDPNQLYDIKGKLEAFDVTRLEEINAFAHIFFSPGSRQSPTAHAGLHKTLDEAVSRYQAKPDVERQEYKSLLESFLRMYSFLSQVMPFMDSDLEKFYAYGRLLVTKLQGASGVERWQVSDEVSLEYYRLQKMREGGIALSKGDGVLAVASEVGTGKPEPEEDALSEIIKILNAHFGTEFTDSDQLFFEQIERDMSNDDALALQAQNNSLENFKYPFDSIFIDRVVERMEQNQEITDRIMGEEAFGDTVRDFLVARVYERLRNKK